MDPYLNFANNFTNDPALAATLAWIFMIVAAALILVVGYFLCKLVANLIAAGIDKVPFMKKVNEDSVPGEETVGKGIGQVLFYLLYIFVIAIALSVIGLGSVIQPVEEMWREILTYLPNVIAAVVILGLGLLLATVVRKLVESILVVLGIDGFFNNLAPAKAETVPAEKTAAATPLASGLSWVVFTLIAIPVVLAAVEALSIASITGPVSLMLTSILEAIPRIFVALLILAIAFFISRFVANLIERLLPSLGFDTYVSRLGILEPKDEAGLTATKAVSTIAQIAILLVGAVEATKIVGFQVLSDFVEIILVQGGDILFGLAVIIAGFIFANVAGRVLDAAGSGASDVVAKIVKYSILAFFTIIGLSAMAIDPTNGMFVIRIVEYLVVAIAVLIGLGGALAFGLGGRDWAGEKLHKWFDGKSGVFASSTDKVEPATHGPETTPQPAAVKARRTTRKKPE